MELSVIRKEFTERSTIGDLLIGDDFCCFTLEDMTREPGVKIPGKTAIPEGRYSLIIDQSVRFRRAMPHILDVPMFTGIRIHTGNRATDVEGCIAVGYTKEKDFVGKSVAAFNHFFDRLYEILLHDKAFITIMRLPSV
jgi:hypothetical protein